MTRLPGMESERGPAVVQARLAWTAGPADLVRVRIAQAGTARSIRRCALGSSNPGAPIAVHPTAAGADARASRYSAPGASASRAPVHLPLVAGRVAATVAVRAHPAVEGRALAEAVDKLG